MIIFQYSYGYFYLYLSKPKQHNFSLDDSQF